MLTTVHLINHEVYHYLHEKMPQFQNVPESVLVAISGGADSVALLHMLVKAGHSCTAVHCNFHLRGAESDRDENFVKNLCSQLNVPLHIEHFNTQQYAQSHKISIEMAARELRYNLFESLLNLYKLPAVAVAHHADDAAETFMLNVARGTGIRGLAGMKEIQGHIVRPLLNLSRLEIEDYCHQQGLSFVTDSSNLEDEYTRNKIRHNIIPVFKGINPSFLNSMNSTMRHLNSVYGVFLLEIENFRKRAVSPHDNELHISLQELRNLNDPEIYLFEILNEYGFSEDSIHKIASSLNENNTGKIWYSNNYRLIFDRLCLILAHGKPTFADTIFTMNEGDAIDQPIRLSIRSFSPDKNFAFSRNPNIVHLDADKVTFPLTLRTWREGDKFRPLGMKGWKKLSDFFVDRKMSQTEKESAWILESQSQIVWIVNQRVDDRFKYTNETKRILEITYTI